MIYPFGDIKTNTSRFPKEELARLVGPLSGDWATITTQCTLPDGTKMDTMGLGHRRGGEVHTFGATCGKTLLGNPQKHKDDDLDEDTMHIIARKCPQLCNDATTAQPKIDRTNKRRQHNLAIERNIGTHSFPLRLFSTVFGTSIADTYHLHVYHNKDTKLQWNNAVRRMALALIHNNLDAIDAGELDADDLFDLDKERLRSAPLLTRLQGALLRLPTHSHPCFTHIF